MVRGILRAHLLRVVAGAVMLLRSVDPAGAANAPVTFSVIADVPYEASELAVLAQHVTNHNRYSPADLLVHLGDIVGSSGPCVETAYQDVANALLGLAVPAFIIPGDNEWNDCDEPGEAWNFWETYFTDFEGNFCGTPAVQGQLARPENFAFVDRGVLFVGINLPGGSTPPGGWSPLLQQDADWVGAQLAGQQASVRAAVIFAHAGPGQSKHATFFDQFVPDAAAFAKPILYLHGDGHTWRMDRPFTAQNVLRVQLERGTKPPVEVTVGLDPVNPFTLDRDPWPSGTPRFNKPPCVEAVPDLSVDLGDVVNLDALVTDDGDPDPPGDVTTLWSQVSGPGPVTIASPTAIQTTAVFPDSGTFVLRLGADDGSLQTSDDVSVEVIGNDPLFTVDDAFVTEGQDAVFTVRLLAAEGPASVSYATADGSAGAPGDYSARSGTLNLSTTTTTGTVSVPVFVDGLFEGTESFLLNLSDPSGASLAESQAVAVVLDADVPPPPEISSFTPVDGTVGAEVTLAGANFTGATQVRFNGTVAASFVVDSDSQIRTVVPSGATSGPLSVTASGGTGASAASFAVRLPLLQVEVSGAGSVALSPPGGSHPLGSVVTLTAIPASGFEFAGWSGDLSGGTSPATIVMNGDRSVNASFTELPPGFVSLDVALDGPGSVATSPAGRIHPVGTLVTLTATPASGHVFGEWSGDVSGTGNAAWLILSGHRSVTATFLGLPPGLVSLDLAVTGPGSVVQSPAGRVQPAGTLVTLSALPDPGSGFAGWSGDLSSAANPVNVALNASQTVTATFGPPATDVTFADAATGVATSTPTVSTSTDVLAVASSLYLAAVTTKNYVNTTSVSGLGLTWNELADQCGGRSQTGVSLWWAQGAPSASGPVTAGFASTAGASSLVVARYTGTPLASALGDPPHVVSANTLGVAGICSGGVDSSSYAVPFTTLAPEALVFSAAARRQHAHTPGAGWTERAETMAGSGGSAAGIAVQDRAFPLAGPVTVAGSIASTTDWAVAAVEVHGSQLELPQIASFDPGEGPVGTVVTLAGQGFTGTTVVALRGTPADFVVDSDVQIRATVPVGAISGPIRVVNPAGASESAASYLVLGPPIVASFAPPAGPVATEVTIAGGRFTGATSVAFAGTPAPGFVVDSDVRIRANVPTGATSGPIAVTNPLGTGASAGSFTVIDPPTIDSFAPPSGPVGTQVTVSGSGFATATSVTFAATTASFVVDSDVQITATVPAGAATGPIGVTNAGGTGASATAFLVTAFDCANGLDDDGDGAIDSGEDPGCDGPDDASERSPSLPCDDGADNDGDGLADCPADPGCQGPAASREHAACQDGLDNDGDGKIDFDGGASRNGGTPIAPPDTFCSAGFIDRERKNACGLGFELALVLPLLAGLRRRTRPFSR